LRSDTVLCTERSNNHPFADTQTLHHVFYGSLVCTPAVEGGMSRCQKVRDMQVKSRLYSYISDENVFFAITFALSFMLGAPCALVGLFG
jgi:hypothetical protein